MKLQLFDIITSLIITIFLLIILEIFNTTVLPIVGILNHRLPFDILIILFLGFRLGNPSLAVLILVIQYFHSFFSVEGWAMGTFAGTMVCMAISYLKDLIHLSNPLTTIVVTQIFQFFWFLIISVFIYLKLGSFDYILSKFLRFLPESLILSCIAPLFFALLNKIWKSRYRGLISEDGE